MICPNCNKYIDIVRADGMCYKCKTKVINTEGLTPGDSDLTTCMVDEMMLPKPILLAYHKAMAEGKKFVGE